MEIEFLSEWGQLDAIDQQILLLLKSNAKLGTKEIAAQIGLTTTPTYERIRRLEKRGIIKSYTAIIDKKKQGLTLSVLCNVQLKSHAAEYLEEFEQAIIQLDEVTDCFHIAGNFDYLLKIYIKDMDSYAVFVKEKLAVIPHIATVQSSFVMRTLKEEY
ncbi:MAG TPA: Lrp/AsnC family transcriptional regulator [Taishania sp.]|jgi:DNA-binding Lrp family transcriptional regulator|nr:Lrp/AsnC family transcriptional regulator [Taishania sp.]HNS41876.1 Lrp/AsnC family transcriptional regulator [Taishania sp.]